MRPRRRCRRLNSSLRISRRVLTDRSHFAPFLGQIKIAVVAKLVIAPDVPRLLREYELLLIRGQHFELDEFAALGIDRMGDVGVEFGAAVLTLVGPILRQSAAALAAEHRSEAVLRRTL